MKIKSRQLLLITAIYFSISFIPVLARWKVEIFPFFSFKLFSKIPQSFDHADVLLNNDMENPEFLIHGNTDLTRIQARFYAAKVREHVENYYTNPAPDLLKIEIDGYSGRLVVLKGDYILAATDGRFLIKSPDKQIGYD